MDIDLMLESLPKLGRGAWLTLQLTVVSTVMGFFLSLPTAYFSAFSKGFLGKSARAYIFCLRGTPLLVQLFLVYYGLSQFEMVRNSLLWPLLKGPYGCAVITFSLNTSAYSAEAFRGAFLTIPKGQIEAAKSLGMSLPLYFRKIIWPQALPTAFPAYSNEVVLLLKASSLASTITLLDLTGMTKTVIAETYKPLELYLLATLFYLLLTSLATLILKFFNKRLRPLWSLHPKGNI